MQNPRNVQELEAPRTYNIRDDDSIQKDWKANKIKQDLHILSSTSDNKEYFPSQFTEHYQFTFWSQSRVPGMIG